MKIPSPKPDGMEARTRLRLPPYVPSSLPLPRAYPAAGGGDGDTTTPIGADSTLPPHPQPGTIPTRFLLLSDTHNTPLFPWNDRTHAFKSPLPSADVLLHAGDLSNWGRYHQLRTTFDMLVSARAELKLVIAGNHDLLLDPAYVQRSPLLQNAPNPERLSELHAELAAVRDLWTGPEAQAAGIVYLDEGLHRFTLSNGAGFRIFASPYTPEFGEWAFMYPTGDDRWSPPENSSADDDGNGWRPSFIPDAPDVDIVMTHGPAHGILDRGRTLSHLGCPHLARALARARPRLHVFGHIHEDWGAMRIDWRRPNGGEPTGEQPTGEHPVGGQSVGDQSSMNTTGGTRYLAVGNGEDEAIIKQGYVRLDLTGGDGGEALRAGEETVAINAAIQSARFQPENAPWVVDLLLPADARNV